MRSQETCQLVLAVVVGGESFSTLNVLGLCMCMGGICIHVFHKYTLLTTAGGNDDQSPEDGDNGGGVGGDGRDAVVVYDKGSEKQVRLSYRSTQSVPLLNEAMADSDSDDSQNANQNSSDIIFDVLKRRDNRR